MRPTPLRGLLIALSLLAASLLEAGCTSYGRPMFEVALEANATLEPGPSLLVPGDTVSILWLATSDTPERSITADVRPDGKTTLGSLGEVQIGGLTAAEAEAPIRALIAKQYPNSPASDVNITFGLQGIRSVYVMGDVIEPGEVPIKGRMSMVEALAAAGGPRKETAMLEYALLVRWSQAEKRQRSWRIDASVERWEEGAALLLQPHDVIFIPNTPIDDVDIWVDQYIRRMLPFPGVAAPPVY
ncbi:MAG: polysaccharide biosynthesis/export family protein [Planctomycetes bacterium]|nr:polysaccharide biosynthesis/export family protein [Planctomycetota bacterium]